MFNTKQIVSKGSFNPDLVYQMAVRPYICPKFQVKKLIYVESEGTESFDVSKNSQNKIGSYINLLCIPLVQWNMHKLQFLTK